MKFEQDRNQDLHRRESQRLVTLEISIVSLRRRVAKALSRKLYHKSKLPASSGEMRERRDKWMTDRSLEHQRLEERLGSSADLATRISLYINEILAFTPVQEQLAQLPQGYELKGERPWRLRNSRFKTLQDVFTPPQARVLPEELETLPREADDHLNLNACPIDPARIPEWFVETMGWDDLSECTEFESLRHRADLIPKLRELFEHLEPLSAFGRRPSFRMLAIQDYDPDQDGKLLVTSSLPSKKSEKRIQVYPSPYEAHRRALHASTGYESEKTKLHAMRQRVESIRDKLVGRHADDEEIPTIKKAILHEYEILRHVTSQYKIEARDILEDCKEVKDKRGRHNPGASCAKLLKVIADLEKRMPQIFDRSAYIEEDRRILEEKIQEASAVLHRVAKSLSDYAESLKGVRKSHELDFQLTSMPSMESLRLRPFNLYRDGINREIEAIKHSIGEKDPKNIQMHALNAYVVSKIFKLQSEREGILKDLAVSPLELSIDDLHKRARGLFTLASSREVLPGVTTSFEIVYAELEQKIATLEERLNYYKKQDMTSEERLEMYERLKRYLEDIDFTEILEKMG